MGIKMESYLGNAGLNYRRRRPMRLIRDLKNGPKRTASAIMINVRLIGRSKNALQSLWIINVRRKFSSRTGPNTRPKASGRIGTPNRTKT